MFRKLLLWTCLVFLTTPVAQAENLSQLVERALSRNAYIASLQARVGEKKSAALQARAWQNPLVDFAAGGKQAGEARGPVYQLGLSQSIFFPGKRDLRGQIVDLDARMNEVRCAEARLALTHDVIRLAYEVHVNGKKKEIIEARKKRFALMQSYLEGHAFPSPQQKTESRIVAIELRHLNADLLQISGAAQSAYEKLNLYLGWEDGEKPAMHVPWLSGNGKLRRGQWLAAMIKKSFVLEAQRLVVEGSRKEVDLARKEAWPDFTLSSFMERETAGDVERKVAGGISLPMPLLNRNAMGVDSAQKKLEAEEQLLRYYGQQLQSQCKVLCVELEVAQKTLRRYPGGLLHALEGQLNEAEGEFRKGRLNLLTFLEMDSQAADTQLRALDAQLGFLDKFLGLLFLAREEDAVGQLAQQ